MNEPERIAKAIEYAQALALAGFGIVEAYAPTADGGCTCRAGTACPAPGKHPIGNDWQKRATRSAQTIAERIARHGQYGVIPWPGEGGAVFDIDHHEQLPVKLPPSFRVTRGPERGHAYYTLPAGYDAATLPATAAWGEVRVEGASRHVIGPYSRHASGDVYLPHGTPADIAEIPVEVLAELFPPEPEKVAGNGYGPGYHLPGPGYRGSRYDEILRYVGSLYMARRNEDEIWTLVRDVLAPLFAERLTEPELFERFSRAWDKTPERLGEPNPEPFRPVTGRPDDTPQEPVTYPEPEDRGMAALSELGEVEYVEDILRPGRIVVVAAEESTGKSFAIDGELAIRVAVAGGSFAGTWPVLVRGPVLVLSEMHGDDDYAREAMVLDALGLQRADLAGRYYRLGLMTAAGGEPALRVDAWRAWVTDWLKAHAALLLIVDTATAATNVDPWGPDIQAVYRGLRVMLDEYPALAIVLVVQLKKPQGRGERRISDVLGEWGRWNDATILMENDGASLERVKLTVRKRVRRERRVIATKAGGLLIDPTDIETTGPKVPLADVVAAISASPGLSMRGLAEVLGVSRMTATAYAATAERQGMVELRSGPKNARLAYPTGHLPTHANEATDRSPSQMSGHLPATIDSGRWPTGTTASPDKEAADELMERVLAVTGGEEIVQ